MADLPALLAGRLECLPQIRRWVIAFSGGVDSRVLLELCARQLPAERLLALHIDHQVQSCSGQWAERCATICARLGVPFQRIAVNPSSSSEADLRDARYAAFLSVLQQGDCLLLAQHADDQAETLLLRLLRGAGVRGLAAMPWKRTLGPAMLLRPLLDQPRQLLEQWAREQGLEWVEDPSNADQGYDRNWLRLNLLPLLRGRWPALYQRVSSTTEQLAEASELLDEIAAEDLRQAQRGAECLALDRLSGFSLARKRNLLRYWVHRLSGHWMSGDELRHLELQVLDAGEDRMPALQLGRYWLRRYRQRLYLLPPSADRQAAFALVVEPRQWALAQGRLSFESSNGPGIAVGTHLSLVYRQGGERLRPLGRGGSVSLKQLLQEAGVPPWWRADWPLLYRDGEIVAVPGICLCEGAVFEGGLTPRWQPLGLSDGGGFGRL
ncbi:tRNA lysidine(34) synthetase TilS [Marinobacterium sp. D7]|uniref:tRNA lysidine(34) synthetase TilS n=1 Tax=Marinobacterium ramblicola TaxID=2849041 RepID=UPI001C2DAE2F|nr:tRNA lysidine(34) synthetase TilS [Marinobacterium ramblicola]MBV1788824.1 tRNA lysidine(34) synthetase TilS [Marinobacterium ramblicola]